MWSIVNKAYNNYDKVLHLQKNKKCYNLETTFQKKVKFPQKVRFIGSYYETIFQIPVPAALGKWTFPVILSDKWVVKNKVSMFLYSFWKNVQGHFWPSFYIVNGSFQNDLIFSVLKSPLNYFLPDSSTTIHHTNTPLLEKNYGVFCLPCNFYQV